MLDDENKFKEVESFLIKRGTIKAFEEENGKITGRMMITLTEIPSELDVHIEESKSLHAFKCSFDFYDSSLGIALYTNTLEIACGMWVTPQVDGADEPSQEWCEFFIETLLKGINEDGSFVVPIYTFVNDTSDFSVMPATE